MSSAGKIFAPGRLWSLWDMLNLLFGAFYANLGSLRSLCDILEREKDVLTYLNDKFWMQLKETLTSLKRDCLEFELIQSAKRIDRILKKLDQQHDLNQRYDEVYARIHLKDLEAAIRDEADDHLVIAIPPDRGKLLQQDNPDFWNGVADKFPSASHDFAAALASYACDFGTASVFHSMRILECGLKDLSEALNLPFGTDVWHVAIDQIESEIRELERRWPKGPSKSEFLKFYSEAAKEFRYFKDGWRNYVTHRLSIGALHAPFEHRKVALNGVGGDFAANVFLRLMVHGIMQREIFAQVFVLIGLIGHHLGFGLNVGFQNRNDVGNGGAIDVEAAGLAATPHKGQHHVLVAPTGAGLGLAFDATNEGLIGLDNVTFAAHGTAFSRAHSLTDAMGNEPCGLEGATEGAM
jgi:hypothetical protein